MKNFLVVMLVLIAINTLTKAAPTTTDQGSTPTTTDKFIEEIRKIVNEGEEPQRAQRATENTNQEKPRDCLGSPCGWKTYNATTRQGIYEFVANACKCLTESYKCVRTGESVSLSAYVYHCRQNTTEYDIEGLVNSS